MSILKKYNKIALLLAGVMLVTGCSKKNPYEQDTSLVFAPTIYDANGEEVKAYYVELIEDVKKYANISEETLFTIMGKPKNTNVYETATSYEYKNLEFIVVDGLVTAFLYWCEEPMLYQTFNDVYKMFGLEYNEEMEIITQNGGLISVSKNIEGNIESFGVHNIDKDMLTFESIHVYYDHLEDN